MLSLMISHLSDQLMTQRVLHIIDHIGMGGAQMIVKNIMELKQNDGDIYCHVLRQVEKKSFSIKHKNFSMGGKYSSFTLKPIREIKNLITKNDISILHCHLRKSQVIGWLLKILYFRNIKLIFHEHGPVLRKAVPYYIFLRLVKQWVNLFVAVSENVKQKLLKSAKIPEEKVVILVNCIDLEKWDPIKLAGKEVIRNQCGIHLDEFVIGYVGSLTKVKGCKYLIEALPHLHCPFRVVIAGDGPLMSRLKKLCQDLKVNERVTFLGYVGEIQNLYPAFDVVVIPSENESFGISAIEAQSLGIPVIASNINGLKEVVQDGETGLHFPVGDSIKLAQCIMKIHDEPSFCVYLKKNMMISVKKYHIDIFLKKLDEMYRTALQ